MHAAALLMIPMSVMAQNGVGLEAGGSMAYMRLEDATNTGTITKTSMIGGAKLGGVADLSLDKHFYLQSGLYFSMKGTNVTTHFDGRPYTNSVIDQKGHYRINYLELPLNILFKTGVQGKGRFFFGGGAYAGYGPKSKGNTKITGYLDAGAGNVTPVDTTVSQKTDMGKGSWDVGALVNAGFEWYNGLFIRANYEIGVKNLDSQAGFVQKTRAVTLSVGYYFGKKRHVKVVEEPLVLPD